MCVPAVVMALNDEEEATLGGGYAYPILEWHPLRP
jgi:hypothetical protein